MSLLVGLGNPGARYAHTRHNIGFLVLDHIASQFDLSFQHKSSLEGSIAQHPSFTLLKPETFMNVSGRSVKSYLDKHKDRVEDILVIYDDADIPFGDVRFKESGSSGGHNGMKSILELFPKGTSIRRVRVGIGRSRNPDVPLDAFVLQPWTTEEQARLPEIITQAAELALTHSGFDDSFSSV